MNSVSLVKYWVVFDTIFSSFSIYQDAVACYHSLQYDLYLFQTRHDASNLNCLSFGGLLESLVADVFSRLLLLCYFSFKL